MLSTQRSTPTALLHPRHFQTSLDLKNKIYSAYPYFLHCGFNPRKTCISSTINVRHPTTPLTRMSSSHRINCISLYISHHCINCTHPLDIVFTRQWMFTVKAVYEQLIGLFTWLPVIESYHVLKLDRRTRVIIIREKNTPSLSSHQMRSEKKKSVLLGGGPVTSPLGISTFSPDRSRSLILRPISVNALMYPAVSSDVT